MRLRFLFGAALVAACDGAASAPTLRLTLVPTDTLIARDTIALDFSATLSPCEGDSAFLMEAGEDGHGALLLLRLDSLTSGSYPVGIRHHFAIRYQRPGMSTVFRADSGTITITSDGRGVGLTIEGNVIDGYSVHRRMSGRLERLVPNRTHASCARSGNGE